jgi:3'-phosphoadenosine 5'-phosphosulfate sulfotransferase (PAPS reductase)/FAD synthetase
MTREELDEKLNGRRLVVSVSGGKDSTAVCLFLQDLGFQPEEYDRVFFDTGWEHSLVYQYLREELPSIVGPILWLRAEVSLSDELEPIARAFEERLGVEYSAMVRLCLTKGMFPSRVRRFCTQGLKVKPAQDFLRPLGDSIVNAVGIRAQESAARALMLEWEHSGAFGCEVWRPLIDWSEEDVIAIHQGHGVKPCRLYLEQGATRVGCYPCIFSRKAELRAMSNYSPERISILADLEKAVGELAVERYRAAGTTLEKKGYGLPGWFVAPRSAKQKDGKRSGKCWPIDKVIRWARTSRGGSLNQIELFTDPQGHQGCVRWGMCETPTND